MSQVKISITSETGRFLISQEGFEDFDSDANIDIFRQLKKDFLEELNIFFKCQVKVYENTEKALRAQLPFLGSVRVDWIEILDLFTIKGHITQEVDIYHEAEADKKIRFLLFDLCKKYPKRYELVVKPKN